MRVVLILFLFATSASLVHAQTLKSLGNLQGIMIGTAVKHDLLANNPTYGQIVRTQFRSLTPSYEMKMQFTQPTRGVFRFGMADQIMNFAENHGLLVHGHTLVWHETNPEWLTKGVWTNAQKLSLMKNHIKNVIGHFKSEYPGRIKSWDVVNEAFNDNGTARSTVWSSLGLKNYLNQAFRSAHAADPAAILQYNDYSIEVVNKKSTALYNLVKDLKASGTPIHSIGMQAHFSTDNPAPTVDALRVNIRRFGALGVSVRFTELDVRTKSSGTTDVARRDAVYRNVATACKLEPACKGITIWGVLPNQSWISNYFPGFQAILLYNNSAIPTRHYNIFRDSLR